MRLYRFRLLSPRAQLIVVLSEGTYLAQRWNARTLVSLYYLADEGRGYFAEVGLDEKAHCVMVLRSFNDSATLADYAQGVRLPWTRKNPT